MGNYGLKVSKAGFDVKTTADKNLIYSSKFDTFRVFASGSGSVTCDDINGVVVTIAHSLLYRPVCVVYSEIYSSFGGASGRFFMLPLTWPIGGAGAIEWRSTTTNIQLLYGVDHAPSGTVLNYKYYIYYNQAI